MASASYDQALRRLLTDEGGYSNHPADPGGPTNFGITIQDYRSYVKPTATAADVRAMRLDEAKAIYRAKYWDAMRCDELPAGLDYAVFDYSVNSGVGRATRVLRQLLGFADGGRIDDALLATIRQSDASELVARLCDERLAFLRRLKTWPVFGAGWGRRVAGVRATALVMAQAQAAATQRRAQASTAGGVAVAGAVAAQQAHQSGLQPAAVAAIAVAAVMLALSCWFLWRWRRAKSAAFEIEQRG